MTRSPSVRYYQILTFSDNRLLVPAFSNTADGLRGVPRWPSADGVTRLPSPLPYVFHLQGIAPKLLTHSGPPGRFRDCTVNFHYRLLLEGSKKRSRSMRPRMPARAGGRL